MAVKDEIRGAVVKWVKASRDAAEKVKDLDRATTRECNARLNLATATSDLQKLVAVRGDNLSDISEEGWNRFIVTMAKRDANDDDVTLFIEVSNKGVREAPAVKL